ncbi:MAG TPA: hypothetical protein VFL76_05935 [Edaphocola sp.]|nr:hypothetical protein [Edaphocola sp.]
MNKPYKAKKIRNLHDLHLEQARVKQAYKNMEQNMVSSVITPDTALSLILNGIIASGKKRKPAESAGQLKSKSFLSSLFTKKKQPAKVSDRSPAAWEKEKKSYKKLGRSLLMWQTASLILFAGINILRHYKNKKRKVKLSSRQASDQE